MALGPELTQHHICCRDNIIYKRIDSRKASWWRYLYVVLCIIKSHVIEVKSFAPMAELSRVLACKNIELFFPALLPQLINTDQATEYSACMSELVLMVYMNSMTCTDALDILPKSADLLSAERLAYRTLTPYGIGLAT